jgi:hypothetical protein
MLTTHHPPPFIDDCCLNCSVRVAGTCIGEFRGKKILNVTAPSLVERQEQLAKSVAATRSVAELKTAELADSFSLLSRVRLMLGASFFLNRMFPVVCADVLRFQAENDKCFC